MAFERELFVATQAVRKASLLTKRIQSEVIAHRDSTTITKSDDSPVTIGDYAAQTIIINAIKANFPEDKIVGEESSSGLSDDFVSEILTQIKKNDDVFEGGFSDNSVQFTSQEYPLATLDDVRKVIDCGNYEGGRTGRFWCLDPIDGTKGFLRGDQFAVCLGLIIDGVVQVGCIGCPNLTLANYGGKDLPEHDKFGYLFSAVKGQGAFYSVCASKNPDWLPIHCRSLKSTSEMISLEGVEKSHSSHDEQSEIKSKLGIEKSLHLDSQVKYCLLALGLADTYLRLPIKLSYQEKIWDHAAGNTIVLEAGGVHTDSMENKPLDFGNGRTLASKGVIATSGPQELHDLVVSTSAEVINSRK
ncbi:3'(2'),5'-bisphosphate nucleotidase [Nakaseomyces bracarensis]|uniref:3'(2'),5'-bisphosphate nucleotidase n=1 Tax=Nakaseomyces bracarensis TaxID=273131 RepID=A0ABR4NQ33_9SACH